MTSATGRCGVPSCRVPTLPQIRSVLADHEPRQMPEPENVRNRACVALVFAGAPDALSLCFIRRTERDDDPWSGHMALPGGRADATDPTPQFTALRETSEEVGLVLEPHALLGALNQIPLRRIVRNDSVLCPFAFYWGNDLPPLEPEQREAEEAYWIPLRHLWDPGNLTTLDWKHEGRSMTFPGIAWGEHVIWGLTHRVLTDFARMLGEPLPAGTPAP